MAARPVAGGRRRHPRIRHAHPAAPRDIDLPRPAHAVPPRDVPQARAARDRPAADWSVRFRPKFHTTNLSYLNDQFELTRLLAIAAVRRHERGDDAEAIELCHDLVRHNELIFDNVPGVLEPSRHSPPDRPRVLETIAADLAISEASRPARQRAARRAADRRRIAKDRLIRPIPGARWSPTFTNRISAAHFLSRCTASMPPAPFAS